MQILHPFAGSIQQYIQLLSDPDRYRPDHCPQCQAKHPLTAHGFYTRTLIDTDFDGPIPVRRYLCQSCQRTVSLLPEFILPYLRSSILLIGLFLLARLLHAQTLATAVTTASMPYQRGQFWIRRFRRQAETLCFALAALTLPPVGVAPQSGSQRPPRRILSGRRARLRLPTHHLSGIGRPSGLRCGAWRKNTRWMKKPKKPLCSATDSSRR
jgi:transposase-like protein